MKERRRNYLVAKRSAMVVRDCANQYRTAIIFLKDTESTRDRMNEHLDRINAIYGSLDSLQQKEIDGILDDSIETGLTTLGNQFDILMKRLRSGDED